MEKKLSDYLPLYLGCEVIVCDVDGQQFRDKIESVYDNNSGKGFSIYEFGDCPFDNHDEFGDCPFDNHDEYYQDIKLVLRPLSSMTIEEMKELYFIVHKRNFVGDNITHRDIGTKDERWVLWSGVERLFIYNDGDVGADSDLQYIRVPYHEVFVWQLSKHFDLFGLIDAGLAIDKSKL